MKRNVDIKKKIEFPSMIGEIVTISVENYLQFTSDEAIEGNLVIVGKYKKTQASQLEEEFKYAIPVEITLTEKASGESSRIDIVDFYYDIVEDNKLLCHVELSVDTGELISEERECDGDPISEKEVEIPHIEKNTIPEVEVLKSSNDESLEKREAIVEEINDDELVDEKNSSSIFNFDNTKETYGSFVVYMVRQNETINMILEKYNTSLEEIEKYNDVKNIEMGSKIIIPILNEKN